MQSGLELSPSGHHAAIGAAGAVGATGIPREAGFVSIAGGAVGGTVGGAWLDAGNDPAEGSLEESRVGSSGSIAALDSSVGLPVPRRSVAAPPDRDHK